ncbi:LysR substrate-binding domain-containing protein [Pseudomonas sp. MWU16-30316]|uniref:LysR substrate-binding domain-containing protein n=1 Tax=Pseudomonas sp. MWU16-30316 TaxID=2878093 RepID=UPI001CF8F7C7|nr:LysR substrate-binding domain-containing protein [Pseudomonas sp. MWU16-30316]
MRINPRQVEAFHAVMRTGSMTGAANLMSITQPAVTRLIRDFEDAIGLPLFERRGNQLIPTPQAAALIPEVERSFIGLERIGRLAAGIREHTAGSIRIAAMPAVANTLLPRFLAEFLQVRPDLQISILGVPSHQVVEMVSAGQVDIGYAEGPLNPHGVEMQAIDMDAVAVMPSDHPMSALKVVVPIDFQGQRFIGLRPGSIFSSGVQLALAQVPRLTRLETSLTYTACALVSQGLGVSIVDPPTALDFIGKGLEMRPLSVKIDTGFLVIRSNKSSQQMLTEEFSAQFLHFYRSSPGLVRVRPEA